MQSSVGVNNTELKYWKNIFWITSLFVLIIMLFLSKDYGQTGDEWLQIEYGKDIYNYFFHGDQQALDYANKSFQYEKQNLYGGFYDYLMELMHRMFPSTPILRLRHFFNALTGVLLMVFTGLIARRLTGKWMIAVLALLFMFFSPRIFGESMNNPKDIPFAAGYTIGLYSLIAFLQDAPKRLWVNAIGICLGWAIAFGVRSAGGLLLVANYVFFIALYFFFNKDLYKSYVANGAKVLKHMALVFFVALIVGYIIALFTWPWGLQSPLSSPIASLQEMTNRDVVLSVLFEGKYQANNAMPWYYEFKWIMMSNPVIIIVGFLGFFLLSPKAIKKYGPFAVVFLVFCALFPILYMIYKHSSVHDTWRHLFFVYPYWVIMAAVSFALIADLLSGAMKYIPYSVAVLGLMPAIIWIVKEHPNQYVYFNEFVGGIEGANGYYETEYYQNAGKQAADWIRHNAQKVDGRQVLVMSSMSDYGRYYRDGKDSTWIGGSYVRYSERHHTDWDYYVTYPRYKSPYLLQNGLWPPKNAVYVVEAGGVPLCAVLKRTSNASVEAYKAFEAKNYELAVQKYEEYLKTDQYDENIYRFYAVCLASVGRVSDAIAATEQAIKLDPSRPDFYEMLYYLYSQSGNKQKAEEAYRRMNAAKMEMQ